VAYSKQVLNQVFEPELDPLADKELFDAFEGCWAARTSPRAAWPARRSARPAFQGH